MQKISRHLGKAIACAMVLGLFSSCASQQTSDELLDLEAPESALLDVESGATPVTDESAIFADLNGQPANSDTLTTADTTDASTGTGSYYDAIGGESLGRVAHTLFSDRKKASVLRAQNSDLAGVKSLSANQKVYFDLSDLKPAVTFLTKGLIERYPDELGAKIESSNMAKETTTIAPGETLQKVSQRLYGSPRYWAEIYLLNRASIKNYDRVQAGLSLSVFQRVPLANVEQPAAPQVEAPAAVVDTQNTTPPEAQLAETPPPAVEPVVPADPIPETPEFSAPPAPVEVVTQAPPPSIEQQPSNGPGFMSGLFDFNNSANVRRGIYIALILAIGAIAFFMTRAPKKKFDMLDVTTSDTAGARSRLNNSDSQHQEIS